MIHQEHLIEHFVDFLLKKLESSFNEAVLGQVSAARQQGHVSSRKCLIHFLN
jgi:hypothetical protein